SRTGRGGDPAVRQASRAARASRVTAECHAGAFAPCQTQAQDHLSFSHPCCAIPVLRGGPYCWIAWRYSRRTRRVPRITSSPTEPPPPISPKRSPQMGISRLPWAGTTVRPSITAAISATGKCPPRRCAIRGRSAGGVRRARATGPPPRPVIPRQALHYPTHDACPALIVAPGMGGGGCAATSVIPMSRHPKTPLPKLHGRMRFLLSPWHTSLSCSRTDLISPTGRSALDMVPAGPPLRRRCRGARGGGRYGHACP